MENEKLETNSSIDNLSEKEKNYIDISIREKPRSKLSKYHNNRE